MRAVLQRKAVSGGRPPGDSDGKGSRQGLTAATVTVLTKTKENRVLINENIRCLSKEIETGAKTNEKSRTENKRSKL